MNRTLTILLTVNFLILALRYLYILFYPIDLAPDEALYWEYSRRPDISYYSKPPLVGYLILLSTALLGDTEIGVRFFPPIFALLSSLIIYRFSRDLGLSETKALGASLLPHFLAGPSLNAVLMTIDAPFIFFYSLSLWILYRALSGQSLRLWILGGVSSALALLSKYTAVFLIPGLVLFRPRLLRERPFWIFVGVMFLAFLPVLLWNALNDFVGFRHLIFLAGKKEGDGPFLTLKYLPEFILGQMAILSVIPFFFMLVGFYRALKEKRKEDLYLTLAVLPVFLFFLLLSFKTRVYANWSAFPYMAGIILAVKFMGTRALIASFILGLISLLPLYFPLLPPDLDMKKRVVGWEELGRKVSEIYNPTTDFIIAPTYQLSSELAFYVRGKPYTYCINLGRRMNDYDLWKENLPRERGKNAVFVTYWDLDPRVREAFEEVLYEGVFEYRYRSKVIRRLKIYRLRGFKGYIKEEIPTRY